MTELTFQKGAEKPLTYPLTSIPQDKGNSGLVSPRVGNDHGLEPLEPMDAEMAAKIMECVDRSRNGEWSPELFAEYDLPGTYHEFPMWVQSLITDANLRMGYPPDHPYGATNLVHMDRGRDFGLHVLDMLSGVPAEARKPVDHIPFLRTEFGDPWLLFTCLNEAMERCFEAKWFFGRARMEEYYEMPSPHLCTSYPEGCPRHPGDPAGHGANLGVVAAVGSRIARRDLIEEHAENSVNELTIGTKVLAMFRTLAGMHDPRENMRGWDLGHEVAEEIMDAAE